MCSLIVFLVEVINLFSNYGKKKNIALFFSNLCKIVQLCLCFVCFFPSSRLEAVFGFMDFSQIVFVADQCHNSGICVG